jgi:hypothetical protein
MNEYFPKNRIASTTPSLVDVVRITSCDFCDHEINSCDWCENDFIENESIYCCEIKGFYKQLHICALCYAKHRSK